MSTELSETSVYKRRLTLSRPVVCPNSYDHYSSRSKRALARVCMVPYPRKRHLYIFFHRSRSQSVVKLGMGGLNMPIATESHISVIHVYVTDGGGGGLQHNREKNKQVSKVIEKISEAETNVPIMRLAG